MNMQVSDDLEVPDLRTWRIGRRRRHPVDVSADALPGALSGNAMVESGAHDLAATNGLASWVTWLTLRLVPGWKGS